MLAVSSVFLLIVASLCYGDPTTDRQCSPDTIDFATKVAKSSVVVYGKSMAKTMDKGSDRTFDVFFQVDCILKGPATLRQINITNAGRAEGKQYCQEFPAGHGYSIAFLEPSSNKTDYYTYVPTDFAEIADVANSTSQLLARACDLHRLVPRQSIAAAADMCPPVGTDPSCHKIADTTVIMATNVLNNTINIISSDTTTQISNKTLLIPGDQGQLTHPIHTPQQELDAIRSKSGMAQGDHDRHNDAKSMTFSILLTIMALFFCSNKI